jgi:hypothetical protein
VHHTRRALVVAAFLEDDMAEIKAQVQQAVSSIEKALAEQTARYESAVAELTKIQSKSIAQAQALFEDVARVAREQIAFAEEFGGEWRKLWLASAKSAGELFAHKA